MTYQELLHKLYSINQKSGIKFGLENTKHLCTAFGNPEKHFTSIHIAGTNGKGSVTTKIAKGFELSGKRTGLYTSPHISCFRERIRINGEMISEESVRKLLLQIFSQMEKLEIPATFFEVTTVLAFLYYAQQKVDVAVLETGLGGRLDSTNVIVPTLSVITSISLEHTEVLGKNVEDIAKEKGGIIKKKVPIIIGPRVPIAPISEIAKLHEAPLHRIDGAFADFHEENCAIAAKSMELLKIKPSIIQEALLALPPCRMETITPKPGQPFQCPAAIILDVAHNPDGLTQLFAAVRRRYPEEKLRIVCGLSKNKDIQSCIQILGRYGDHFHLVASQNGRGLSVDQLYDKFIENNISDESLNIGNSIEESVQLALHEAVKNKEVVIICGTFFIMSAVRRALHYVEPTDPIDLNEKVTKPSRLRRR